MKNVEEHGVGRSGGAAAAGALALLLVLCLFLRLVVLSQFWPDLSEDRDAYLGIAQGMAAGRGFSVPGSDRPTAFRPPLYPILLAPFSGEDQKLGRALLHLLAATGTALLIWKTAAQLRLGRLARSLATLLFVVDPLLLRYFPFPMTETITPLLSALLLWQLTRPAPLTPGRGLLAGLTFGACVLCRPTYWLFGILALPFWFLIRNEGEPVRKRTALAVLAGVALLVLPWTIRNWIVLGAPVAMTTHGGYTILLGNNEAFYREVVLQPWGTVWDGSHGPGQAAWAEQLNRKLDRLGLESERERDRWMAREARRIIAENPDLFLRACLLRLMRFWNVVPIGPERGALPAWLLWGSGLFYSLLWIATLLGVGWIVKESRRDTALLRRWGPLLLLIGSFTLVHLVYWSNARMRAPVMPAVYLLSTAWLPLQRASQSSRAATNRAVPSARKPKF